AVVAAHEVFARAMVDDAYPDASLLVAAVVGIWDRIIFAEGEGPLELAVRRAAATPVNPHPSVGRLYARLLSVAYHLQEHQGDKPILLPVHRLDTVLGVSPRHVGRLIDAAVRLGHLQMVDASYRPGQTRRLR